MADMLAAPDDLASLLERDDLDLYKTTLLIECATAVVQNAAGGQRIVQVVDDVADLTGDTSCWLDLPQIPVTAVSAVTLDGSTISAGVAGSGGKTWRRRGDRLWRGEGWQQYRGEPSDVLVTYTHGYPALHQKLQFGRNCVLGLIRDRYDNPGAIRSEKIDDYAVVYAALSDQLEQSPHLKAAIRREYGRRGGLVRIGGSSG